jgi:hypothetical protein
MKIYMNKNILFTFSVVVSAILLLIAGAGIIITTPSLTTTAYAQTLGAPFLEEKGKITSQKEIGDNRTEVSFSANGTMRGNINVTNTGTFLSISKGNNVTYAQGQGVIMTRDGSDEKANHTFQFIGNITQEGKPVFYGSAIYNTNSTGKIAFLDNLMGIYKGEIDEMGNFVSREWQWK